MARPKGSKNKPKENVVVIGKPKRAGKKTGAFPASDRKVTRAHNEPTMNADEEQAKMDCFNAHRDKIRPLEARLESVKKLVAEAYADAKKDKLAKKMFAIAKKLLGTKKQEDGIIGDIRMVRFVAKAVGHSMAAQFDLFAQDDKPSTISPEQEGEQASRDNKPAKPPYAAETEQYQRWMAGYYAHQETLAKGIKPMKKGAPTQGRREGPAQDASPPPDDGWGDDEDPAAPFH